VWGETNGGPEGIKLEGPERQEAMEKDGKGRIFDFFDTERKRFLRYVKSKMAGISQMDAEDVVAEVMLTMLQRAERGSRVENLAAYVYRSLSNGIVDLARRRSRTVSLQSLSEEDGETSLLDYLADGSQDVHSETERREFMRRLIQAMDSLEPKQRAVFIATEVKGLTFRELSIQWNEPVGTLLSRKCRAVKALKEKLRDLKP
jgi:RNA polymerase sigma factor (sigma-70 family)